MESNAKEGRMTDISEPLNERERLTWGAALAAAFAAAQGSFEQITKDKTATVSSERAAYEYDYATLAAYHGAARAALRDNGLGVSHEIWVSNREFEVDEKGGKYVSGLIVNVQTTILHASGEYMRSRVLDHWLPGARITEIGSCSSFLKRYQVVAMLAMTAADENDDEEKLPADQRHTDERRWSNAEPKPASGTSRPARAPQSSGPAKINNAQLTILRKKAADAGMDEAQIAKRFSVSAIKDLPFDSVQAALAYVQDPQRDVINAP
jgi:hypothetical protein